MSVLCKENIQQKYDQWESYEQKLKASYYRRHQHQLVALLISKDITYLPILIVPSTMCIMLTSINYYNDIQNFVITRVYVPFIIHHLMKKGSKRCLKHNIKHNIYFVFIIYRYIYIYNLCTVLIYFGTWTQKNICHGHSIHFHIMKIK